MDGGFECGNGGVAGEGQVAFGHELHFGGGFEMGAGGLEVVLGGWEVAEGEVEGADEPGGVAELLGAGGQGGGEGGDADGDGAGGEEAFWGAGGGWGVPKRPGVGGGVVAAFFGGVLGALAVGMGELWMAGGLFELVHGAGGQGEERVDVLGFAGLF